MTHEFKIDGETARHARLAQPWLIAQYKHVNGKANNEIHDYRPAVTQPSDLLHYALLSRERPRLKYVIRKSKLLTDDHIQQYHSTVRT